MSEIQGRLQGNPNQPYLLELSGRAELIEGDLSSAIRDLMRAAQLESSPEIDVDLGTAYALRGDAERSDPDYSHARDLLLGVVHNNPRNANALFNLALVYERLSMNAAAIETWRRFLAVAPPDPWVDEARRRLQDLARKR
jgi:cytochrome c-type biogenesis protein CcmH/NrfG